GWAVVPPPSSAAVAALGDLILEQESALGWLRDQPQLAAAHLPRMLGDLALVDSDQAGGAPVVLDCPIVALAGTDDDHVAPESVAAWAPLTRAHFQCELFSGNHFFLHPDQRQGEIF